MADAKDKIFQTALKEFSKEGFGGARVERIAKNAGVNKAMIFYYFSSKQNLYQELLNHVMSKIFGQVSELISRETNAEFFFEKMTEVYIIFLSKHQDFIRMIALDMIQNPGNINRLLKTFFESRFESGPGLLFEKVRDWYEKGEITESDPLQFIINILSLNIFVFIGKPIFEAIFNVKIDEIDDFYQNRIKSVVNILKKGMLK
jgi:AcrR family transcriptional regulator